MEAQTSAGLFGTSFQNSKLEKDMANNKEKFTAQQIADALIATNGMRTMAARQLNCDYNTVVRYIKKYKVCQDAENLSKQRMGDRVESTLLAMALGVRSDDGKKWEQEPNIASLIFLAKVHPTMRERGYTEKKEIQVRTWQDEAIDLIKRGDLDYQSLVDNYDESLAVQLFKSAGVPIDG